MEPTAQVPFSSRRRWSALELDGERLVLGAPEALLAGDGDDPLRGRAAEEAATGRRVLALAAADAPLPPAAPDAPLPEPLRPLGVVVLAERLRDERGRDGRLLRRGGGRAEGRSRATARRPSARSPATRASRRSRPRSTAARSRTTTRRCSRRCRAAPAIGRISPEDKARVVRVLAEAGEYVGMLGDGVNDVPALKQARLAIAQGSGTQMARAVADLVLVSGEFGEVPRMVHEGRQILRNIQRVARLFVTKALFTAFLLVTIALPTGVFPLLPRQFTLTSSLTIGIPAFFLALAPSTGPWRPEGFLQGDRPLLAARRARDRHRDPHRLPARPPRVRHDADRGADGHRGDRRRPPASRSSWRSRTSPARGGCVVGGPVRAHGAGLRDRLRAPDRRATSSTSPTPTGAMVASWAIGAVVTIVLLAIALRAVRVLDARAAQNA